MGEKFGLQEIKVDTTQLVTETKTVEAQQHPEMVYYSFSPLMKAAGFFYSMLQEAYDPGGVVQPTIDGRLWIQQALRNVGKVALATCHEMYRTAHGQIQAPGLSSFFSTKTSPSILDISETGIRSVAKIFMEGYRQMEDMLNRLQSEFRTIEFSGHLIAPAYTGRQLHPSWAGYADVGKYITDSGLPDFDLSGIGGIGDDLVKSLRLSSHTFRSTGPVRSSGASRQMSDDAFLSVRSSEPQPKDTLEPGVGSESDGDEFLREKRYLDMAGTMYQLLVIAAASSLLQRGCTYLHPASGKVHFVPYERHRDIGLVDTLAYPIRHGFSVDYYLDQSKRKVNIGTHPMFFRIQMFQRAIGDFGFEGSPLDKVVSIYMLNGGSKFGYDAKAATRKVLASLQSAPVG